MNAETLKALNESIEHWERLANGTSKDGEGIGGNHCALCDMFVQNAPSHDKLCDGCPVSEAGYHGCGNSPWSDVNNHVIRLFDDGLEMETIKQGNFFKDLASKQLAFLKSLLPKDKTI